MSEVILKAVALAMATQEAEFDKALTAIKASIEAKPVVDVTKADVKVWLDEIEAEIDTKNKALMEAIQDALNKTNGNEQELRKAIGAAATEAFETTAKMEQAIRDEIKSVVDTQDALNDETIGLLGVAVDSLREEIGAKQGEADSQFQRLENSLDNINKTLGIALGTIEELSAKVEAQKTNGLDGVGFDTPLWEPAIYRSGSTVQHNIGQIFKAAVDTNAEPGTDETWERVGVAGLRHKGVYNADTIYGVGDLFIKDYGTFLSLGNGHNVMLAGRGAQGKKGDTGPQGKAATVVNCHSGDNGFVMEMSDGGMHPVEYPSNFISVARLKSVAELCDSFEDFKAMVGAL